MGMSCSVMVSFLDLKVISDDKQHASEDAVALLCFGDKLFLLVGSNS